MNLETQTDMLRFILKSKPHKALDFGILCREHYQNSIVCFVYGKKMEEKNGFIAAHDELRFLSVMDAICILQKS